MYHCGVIEVQTFLDRSPAANTLEHLLNKRALHVAHQRSDQSTDSHSAQSSVSLHDQRFGSQAGCINRG
jgi:hypothetical protein